MYSQNLVEKPIHLVSVNSFGKLVLHVEALHYLQSLPSPISILSIAGPYRTGKSFLMNSLISTDTNLKAFQVGNTINQTTHGLWIWGKPILAENQQGKITSVIVMDSEGFASVEGTHDKRIVTLALLVSSCFLYNSKGSIDKDSLFDLQFVIQVARAMQSSQNRQSNCEFHWILRDFHLDLVNQMGIKISPNQYMQNCLLQASEKVNLKTVQTFKQFFSYRNCHCLIQPNLQKQKQQRPQFTQQIIQLRKIFKKIKSLQIDGARLVKILQSYVDAMNNGQNLNRIFQEGYDCRVRLDCIEKLNSQLKSLKDIKQKSDINQKLLGIKSQIKQYYKQRMCSHKQIKILDEDVQEIIQEYQEQNQVKLTNFTSVKVMNNSKQKHSLKIPKVSQNGIRLSINVSQVDQRSFCQKQKQFDKKKATRQQKALKVKIQNLQMRSHRNDLELIASRNQINQLKSEVKQLHRSVNEKQVKLEQQNQNRVKLQARYQIEIEQLKQSLKICQQSFLVSNSQLLKFKLLSNQKIEFLQIQIAEGQLSKINQICQIKTKYKKQIQQLQKQIQSLKLKHSDQLNIIKQIYAQKQKETQHIMKQKENQDFYKQLKCKSLVIQQYKHIIQQLKLKNDQLETQIQDRNKKLSKKQISHKESLEQFNKRNSQTQKNILQIYQTKLQGKDQLILQLQTKIKNLNKVLFDQNRNQIKKLQQKQNEHMMEKQQLHQIISELRSGYLDSVKRIDYLKEDGELKQLWIKTLKQQKQALNYKHSDQQDLHKKQHQQYSNKIRELQAATENYQRQINIMKEQFNLLNIQNKNNQNQINRKLRELQKTLTNQKQRYQQKCFQYSQVYNKNKDIQVLNRQYILQLQQLQKDLLQKQSAFQQFTKNLQSELLFHKYQNQRVTKQKDGLMVNLQKLSAKLQKNYENIQTMLSQKHHHEVGKYQQAVKNMKIHERRLSRDIDQNNMKKVKLQQKKKNLQIQLEKLKIKFDNQSKYFEEQTKKNQTKIQQLNAQLFQIKKQNALLNQKLEFVKSFQQKINKQNQVRNQQKICGLNSTISLLNEKVCISSQKQAQFKVDTEKFRQTIDILIKNQEICRQNLDKLQQQKIKTNISYENHLKLFSKKIAQLKTKNQDLCKNYKQKSQQYQILMHNHSILNKNYTLQHKIWLKQ